jgi:heme A synthase
MKSPLTKHAWGLTLGLVLEYLLGMFTNLFVEFPEDAKEGEAWNFAWSQPVLALHIILGLLLFIGATALAIRSYKARDKVWIRSSGLGLLFIFLAAFGGSSFIPSQKDLYSYLMAISFILAVFSYGWGIYQSKK